VLAIFCLLKVNFKSLFSIGERRRRNPRNGKRYFFGCFLNGAQIERAVWRSIFGQNNTVSDLWLLALNFCGKKTSSRTYGGGFCSEFRLREASWLGVSLWK